MHMRKDLLTIAAVAVGGVVLADQMRRRGTHARFEIVEPYESTQLDVPVATLLALAGGMAAGGLLLAKYLRSEPAHEASTSVHEAIDLEVPVSVAYNQWTQFEEFPRFMDSVHEVKQLNDTHLHWRATVAGKTKEWESEITEQIPDKRIAWRSTGGPRNAGVVTFHKLADNRCRVTLQMDYSPHGLGERVGDAMGAVRHTARGNLKRFKELVEARGVETGAWRGTVPAH